MAKKSLKLKRCRIGGIFWHEIMFLIFCFMRWVGRKASLASNMIQSFRMVGHHPYATLEENTILCFAFKIDRLSFLQKRSSRCHNQVLLWMFYIFHFGQLRSLACNLLQPYNQLWCTEIEGVPPPWADYICTLFGSYEKCDYSQVPILSGMK